MYDQVSLDGLRVPYYVYSDRHLVHSGPAVSRQLLLLYDNVR